MTANTQSSPTANYATDLPNADAQLAQFGSAAACLKAAGDAMRLQILAILSNDAFGVLELSHIFATKQSGMSHHLKVLAKANLVSTRREGNTIFYRRCDNTVTTSEQHLRNSIYALADELSLPQSTHTQLQQIYSQRAEASKAFFIENAQAFREQQDLIAAYELYGPEVATVLADSPCPDYKRVLEIGPGAGEFLPELSQRFEQVIALDSSAEMLQQSRELGFRNAMHNIEFVQNDTSYCKHIEGQLDCVVVNMVLHHTPSPSHIFEDVAHSLKPNGVFIVCDLGAHNQDWVRNACGDHWLGFDANDLKQWAGKNQLAAGTSRYFALRNGFQIQIHQFIKQAKHI